MFNKKKNKIKKKKMEKKMVYCLSWYLPNDSKNHSNLKRIPVRHVAFSFLMYTILYLLILYLSIFCFFFGEDYFFLEKEVNIKILKSSLRVNYHKHR